MHRFALLRLLHDLKENDMARYKDAIEWIAANDDTEWARYPADTAMGSESVTAAMVADIFGKTTEQVRADIIRALKRMGIY